jgi:uncharacterized membrane protein
MRCLSSGLLVAIAFATWPTIAAAAEPTTTTIVRVESPTFPTPTTASLLGLCLTAIVVIAARVTHQSSTTMTYMVLASVAATSVFVATSNKIHSNFEAAR